MKSTDAELWATGEGLLIIDDLVDQAKLEVSAQFTPSTLRRSMQAKGAAGDTFITRRQDTWFLSLDCLAYRVPNMRGKGMTRPCLRAQSR